MLLATEASTSARAELPEMQWKHVYPYPTGSWLNSVTWGPQGFVAVGIDGEVLFSEDGRQWRQANVRGTKDIWFSSVCHYGGKYVAVGIPNPILVSSNGQDWVASDPGTNVYLRVCAGGDGKYVAVGLDKTLLISTNGRDWQQRTTPADFIDIVYGNKIWLALTGSSVVYTSSDLENWTYATVGPFGQPALTSVCFGQGRFVAGGAGQRDQPDSFFGTVIMSSSNGLNWASASLSGLDAWGETKDSVFAGDQFVAVQTGYFLRSTNGETWEKIIAPDVGGTLRGIAASPSGSFAAVGSLGLILTSSNAVTWQMVSSRTREEIYSVAYANGQFVAVGGSPYYIGGPVGSAAVFASTNGYDWQVSLTNLENQLSAVAFGNGLWVVCGYDGAIYTSIDAANWTDHSLPTTHALHQLVYGNGRFVAFSGFSDLVYHSTNGVDWVGANIPFASQINGAKFINGRFMAVGENGLVLSSNDGLTWANTNAPGAGSLNTIAYGKGRYVAGGYFVLAYSFDGTTWTVQPAPIQVYDIQFIDGWFVAVGNSHGMLVSRDGVQWASVDDQVLRNEALTTLTYGNGVVVVGGGLNLYRGTLQDSEIFKQSLHLLSLSQLEFYGASGYDYRLEQSTNLMEWLPISDWIPGSNEYLLWDVGPFEGAQRFWRAAGKLKQ